MSTSPSNRPERRDDGSTGAPESPASNETFPLRRKLPGDVGLANESRPGLGARGDSDPAVAGVAGSAKKKPKDRMAGGRKASRPKALEPHPEPPPAPQEQNSDSLEQEQQRSTGVSGHMGGT